MRANAGGRRRTGGVFTDAVAVSPAEDSEETLRSTKEVHQRAEEKYKVLENKMKNAEAEREKELKSAQQKLAAAKASADAFNRKLKQRQQVGRRRTGATRRAAAA